MTDAGSDDSMTMRKSQVYQEALEASFKHYSDNMALYDAEDMGEAIHSHLTEKGFSVVPVQALIEAIRPTVRGMHSWEEIAETVWRSDLAL